MKKTSAQFTIGSHFFIRHAFFTVFTIVGTNKAQQQPRWASLGKVCDFTPEISESL
jgi:surfactin synthase thioesterase subunit